jgi:ABC-2 type transport system ATP-binding protein
MTTLIQTEKLTKRYGRNRGIDDVTFFLEEGEVFGFLGPNGAGKTTTMRVLMGLLYPSSGSATIGGLDCWKESVAVKKLIGYLPGEYTFDPGLKGAQIIEYLGHLRGGVDRTYVRNLIERLDFDPSKKFREYSRGNKQKLGLIQAFMHKPRLLILDEPTGGLDPLNQQEFYRMVAEVHAEGRTVFLSSHILPEVEHTCDRVAIIREGRIVKIDHVSSLKDIHQHEVEISFGEPASTAWFADLPGVTEVSQNSNERVLRVNIQGTLEAVIRVAGEHQALNLTSREPSLEEIFLRFYEADKTPAATLAGK